MSAQYHATLSKLLGQPGGIEVIPKGSVRALIGQALMPLNDEAALAWYGYPKVSTEEAGANAPAPPYQMFVLLSANPGGKPCELIMLSPCMHEEVTGDPTGHETLFR